MAFSRKLPPRLHQICRLPAVLGTKPTLTALPCQLVVKGTLGAAGGAKSACQHIPAPEALNHSGRHSLVHVAGGQSWLVQHKLVWERAGLGPGPARPSNLSRLPQTCKKHLD